MFSLTNSTSDCCIVPRICVCPHGGLWSKARSVCVECRGRLPLRRPSSDIFLYGPADEMVCNSFQPKLTVNRYWGVRQSEDSPDPQLILAHGFPMRSRGLYEKAQYILRNINSPLILEWDTPGQPCTGLYLIWPVSFIPVTVSQRCAEGRYFTWNQSFAFAYSSLKMLRDFETASLAMSKGDTGAPALQCFWPQNMVLDSCSSTSPEKLSIINIWLWSDSATIIDSSVSPFLAPEVRDGRVPIGPKSDIFSIAATTYYLSQGAAIGSNPSSRDLEPVPGHGRRELLRSMLDPVPAFRPSAERALAAMEELM